MISVPKRVRCKIGQTIYDHVSAEDVFKLPGFTPSSLISLDDSTGWQAAFTVFNFDQKTLGVRHRDAVALDPMLQRALDRVLYTTGMESKAPRVSSVSPQARMVHYFPKSKRHRSFFLFIGLASCFAGLIWSQGSGIARLASSAQHIFYAKKEPLSSPHAAPMKRVTSAHSAVKVMSPHSLPKPSSNYQMCFGSWCFSAWHKAG